MKYLVGVCNHCPRLAIGLMAILLLGGCSGPSTQSMAGGQDPHKNHSSNAASPQTIPTPRIPAFFARVDEAKPLPAVLDPKQFKTPAISKAYQYAKENPELFAQQPCYCYCDAGYQHRSLLDCYASDHSVGCQLCLKEGHLIYKLYKEGKSAAEIRDQIVRGEWQNVRLD